MWNLRGNVPLFARKSTIITLNIYTMLRREKGRKHPLMTNHIDNDDLRILLKISNYNSDISVRKT